jgi:prefoldin beta subunit
MAEMNKELQEQIQRLQMLEQNLQQFLLQKQAFQFELNETENALKEINETKEDVFKLTGQIMIKASKDDLEKELSQKKDVLELRLKAIEKQESNLKKETEKIRGEVMKKIK